MMGEEERSEVAISNVRDGFAGNDYPFSDRLSHPSEQQGIL